jgi:hypothetical protein
MFLPVLWGLSHENNGYQMQFGIGIHPSISYDEFRRPRRDAPPAADQ